MHFFANVLNRMSQGNGIGADRNRNLVGVRGFEPPTTATPLRCATRLRYTPKICTNAEQKLKHLPEEGRTRILTQNIADFIKLRNQLGNELGAPLVKT